jgi:chemotaxis protein CheD
MVKRLAHAHPEELVAQEKRGNAATVACHGGRSVDFFELGIR